MIFLHILLIILQISLTYFIIVNKSKFEYFYYNSVQKSHIGFVPRLGGITLIIFYFLHLLLFGFNITLFNLNLFLGSLIILSVALKEDLYGNTSALFRFIIIIIASFLVVINFDKFPHIDIPIIGDILNNFYFQIFFYTLALAGLANGTNMIDGMNGLSGFTCLSMIFSLSFICFLTGQYDYIPILIILALVLLLFIVFNFPLGLIFLGDAGAYWLGWFIGIVVIDFYASFKEISTWTALVIVSYPIIELVFSFSRKIIQKKSPFEADNLHIHIKFYYALSGNLKSNRFNSVVTLCLMPIWSVPIISISIIHYFPKSVIFVILIQLLIYLLFYYFIPKPGDAVKDKE